MHTTRIYSRYIHPPTKYMSTIVVIGGSGALGKAFISHFKSQNYNTVNVDLFPNPEASINCTPETAIQCLATTSNNIKLIVNAAGGWAGGDASDSEFLDKCKLMWQMNIESAALGAKLAALHLKCDGLLVLVGAKAVAVHPTPDMLAYAMAKSAVASLASNLSVNYPFSVTLLLPEVLDTEANRKAMPEADTSKWTPVNLIAEKVFQFLNSSSEALKEEVNGKSWLIITRSGETKFTLKQ